MGKESDEEDPQVGGLGRPVNGSRGHGVHGWGTEAGLDETGGSPVATATPGVAPPDRPEVGVPGHGSGEATPAYEERPVPRCVLAGHSLPTPTPGYAHPRPPPWGRPLRCPGLGTGTDARAEGRRVRVDRSSWEGSVPARAGPVVGVPGGLLLGPVVSLVRPGRLVVGPRGGRGDYMSVVPGPSVVRVGSSTVAVSCTPRPSSVPPGSGDGRRVHDLLDFRSGVLDLNSPQSADPSPETTGGTTPVDRGSRPWKRKGLGPRRCSVSGCPCSERTETHARTHTHHPPQECSSTLEYTCHTLVHTGGEAQSRTCTRTILAHE